MLAILGVPALMSFGSVGIQANICHSGASTSTPAFIQPQDGAIYSTASPVAISGTSAAGASVSLTDNGTDIATLTSNEVGSFNAQLYFRAGSHTLGITASDACATATGASVTIDTQTPSVVAPPTSPVVTTPSTPGAPTNDSQTTSPSTSPDTTDPTTNSGNLVLSMTSPKNGSTTNADIVAITGSTSHPSKIIVTDNGMVVATISLQQTRFSFAVPIALGNNALTITADDGTDTASTSVNVTRVAGGVGADSGGTTAKPWYKTRTGQAVIIGGASAAVIIIIVILIILL